MGLESEALSAHENKYVLMALSFKDVNIQLHMHYSSLP